MRGMKCPALLLLSVCAWWRGEAQMTVVTGSDATFTATVTSQPSEISWLKNEIKIVDVEEGKEPDFYTFYNIQDRVITSLTEKTFTLVTLTPEDSGNYKAVSVVNGKVTNNFFRLLVLDPVCNVSIHNTTVENNVTLQCLCSSKGANPSQYEWRNVSHLVSDQQNITVIRTQEPQTLWCIARNAVSSSNATITVPKLPGSRRHIFIIIIAILVSLCVLTAIVLYVLYKLGFLASLRACLQRRETPADTEDPSKKEEAEGLNPENEAGAVHPAVNKETETLKNGRAEDRDDAENVDENTTM